MSIICCEEIQIKKAETGEKKCAQKRKPVSRKCLRMQVKPIFTGEKSESHSKKNFLVKYLSKFERIINPVVGTICLMIFALSTVKYGFDGLLGCLSIFYILTMLHTLFIEPLTKK